jgi:group I intron endonuclease
MDNNINQTIIEKVAIKSVAIYKAIAMLPPPEIKDLWAENNYTKQTQNDLKLDAKDNCVTMKKTKTELTPVDWKDITNQNKSGIYKIINKIDGKYYVGRSSNIKKRWRSHRNLLRQNKHSNCHLQRAWNRDGESSFDFILVEEVIPDKNILIDVETRYINKFVNDRKNGIDDCYNLSLSAVTGSVPGNQHRKGKPHSIEDRLKISKGLLGNTNTKGKSISEIHRQKIIMNAPKGKNNHAFNNKIYNFFNKNTGESFSGTLSELLQKENIKINSAFHRVIRGERNHYKGWIYKP